MQREIDALRRQVGHDHVEASDVQPSPLVAVSNNTARTNQTAPIEMNSTSSEVLEPIPTTSMVTSIQQTQERSFDSFVLQSFKINDCFDLYFKHYHPDLPILDPEISPDQYYSYSPLVFWVVIATGSRRYTEDPTLLGSIGSRVNDMAFQSLSAYSQWFQTIQALLLLCNWPASLETLFKDPSLVFSGAAMQLALQHGLHMSDSGCAFDMDQIRSEQDHEAARIKHMRSGDAKLWLHCKTVCQSVSIGYGIEPYNVLDFHQSGFQVQSTGHNLRVIDRLHNLWVVAVRALSRHALLQPSSPISPLVTVFADQVCELTREYSNDLPRVKGLIARLHIVCFYFFDQAGARRPERLVELYQLACSFLDVLNEEDAACGFVLYSSQTVYRAIVLAAFVILRILRSTLSKSVDSNMGERSFFSAMNLLKKRSVMNTDLDAKNVVILSLLWRSKSAFRQVDGSYDGLRVRTRSKGSFSVAYDCYWYWIRELHSQSADWNTANRPTAEGHNQDVDTNILAMGSSSLSPFSYGSSTLFDNEADLLTMFGTGNFFDTLDSTLDLGNL